MEGHFKKFGELFWAWGVTELIPSSPGLSALHPLSELLDEVGREGLLEMGQGPCGQSTFGWADGMGPWQLGRSVWEQNRQVGPGSQGIDGMWLGPETQL